MRVREEAVHRVGGGLPETDSLTGSLTASTPVGQMR